MPVHRRKKDTTVNTPSPTQEQTTPPLPDQQAFQQHLRELARAAIRVVVEDGLARGTGRGDRSRLGRERPKPQRLSQWVLHLRAFSLRLVGSKTYRFREIVRASFIRRCSSAIAAMNPRWPKGSPRCS
jgi:hypothetical protein